MIYNRKQYNVSNAELAKLKAALSAAEGCESDRLWLKQAEINALRSQIAEIEAEISEYEMLTSGQIPLVKVYALEEPRACWYRRG